MADFRNDRMRDAHYWAAQARGFMQQESSASVQDRFRVAIQAGTPFVVLRDFDVPDGEMIANEMMDNGFPDITVGPFNDNDDTKLSISPTDDRLVSEFDTEWRDFESNREFSDDASRSVEETPGGTAAMQEAAMSSDTLTRQVRVEGQPGDRKYNFDDGTDSRKAYIPPSAFMDAIEAVEDELGDANQYVASGDAGTVVFSVGDGFERYEFNRPERDDRYPFSQQIDGTSTNLGSLEPETIEDDDDDADNRQQRTTQGTLGGDSPLDPGEFPTEPDPAAKRQREQMRREEQQESLEGDAPEFDPAADREARERRQRRAEQTQERIADDQANLTGDRVDTDDVVPAETVDDDDDQQGLASFVDDNGDGGGSGN